MTRDEAITILVKRDLAQLSAKKRDALLLDWWVLDSSDMGYGNLPEELKLLMARQAGPTDSQNQLYDPLLEVALRDSYVGVKNSYLERQIEGLGLHDRVVGRVEELFPCACCGYRSLTELGAYEICRVCFWEDDGTAVTDAVSGPNHMSLDEARANFQRIGAVSEAARKYVIDDGCDRYASTDPQR